MRSLAGLLLTSVLFLRVVAAEQLYVVAPDSLDAWSVSGADKSAFRSGPTVAVPAGAQLSREFSGAAVVLRLASRPVLSEAAEEWPIVSVGPAALAFVKKDGVGRMILVLDESRTEELPWTIEPGAATPDLLIGYDPVSGAGLVGFQGELHSFDAYPSAKPVKVWLGAGASAAWPQDLMQVLVLTSDAPTPDANAGLNTAQSRKAAEERLAAALNQLRDADRSHEAGPPLGKAKADDAAKNGQSTLEVFTPPSFRRSKIVAAVRATLAKQASK